MKLKDLKPVYVKGKPPKIKEGEYLLPYLTPEYIRSGATPEYYPQQEGVALVEDGDLILLWDGSNAGEFFKGKRGILSSTMVKIAPIHEADDNYIYYSLKLQEPSLKSKTAGSGIPHVDKEALFNLEVFLPEKSHQSTIATILSTIDQAIEKTERLIAKYERIKTGLMQDLLTRGIDEQGRIRSEETHAFKDSALGRVPVEWEINTLQVMAEISSGVTLGKKHEGKNTILLPYLRVANVQDGFLDLNQVTEIRVPKHEVSKYELQLGDVLMNEGGDFDKLGRGTVWENQIPKCLHQNHVFKVRCNQQKLNPYYLALYSESPFGKKFFVLNSKQSTNLASINSTQLKKYPIPTPQPAEQKRILEKLTCEKGVILFYQNELQKLAKMKTALMQDLLTGKVRVDGVIK